MTTDHVQKGIEQHAAQQAMRLAVLASLRPVPRQLMLPSVPLATAVSAM